MPNTHINPYPPGTAQAVLWENAMAHGGIVTAAAAGLAPKDESDELTPMDISSTTLEKLFSKVYPPAPTQEVPVDSVYTALLLLIKQQGLPVSPSLRASQMIQQGGDVLVGIEIELENYVISNTVAVKPYFQKVQEEFFKVWTGTVDTSLRNSGQEFVTKVGLTAAQVPRALAILRIYLAIVAPKVEFNYRTGTHIHLNVRDFTVEQLINLMMLYVLFEDSLYRVSGNRYKNHFCVPLRAASNTVERLMKVVHEPRPTTQQFRNAFSVFKKYMAFNLLPAGCKFNNPHLGNPHGVKTLGSVEFRHHQGTSDPAELVPWIQKLLDLHIGARTHSFNVLKKIIFNLNSVSNYVQFSHSIFSQWFTFPAEEIANDMSAGSSFIKELYLISKGE